jgi:hypothetical protein
MLIQGIRKGEFTAAYPGAMSIVSRTTGRGDCLHKPVILRVDRRKITLKNADYGFTRKEGRNGTKPPRC